MEKQYEGCFLLKADLTEEGTAEEVDFIEEKVVTSGGKIVKKEFWGKKHLAYPIEKRTDAVFYIFYFTASPEMMLLIEPPLRRRANILRYLFLQRKRLPEEVKEDKDNAGTDSQ